MESAAHIAAGCGSRPLRAMDPEAIDCCSDYRCGDFLIRIYIFQFSSLWSFFCFPSSTWRKRGAIRGLPVRIIERDRHNKTQITWLWPAWLFMHILCENEPRLLMELRGEFVVYVSLALSRTTYSLGSLNNTNVFIRLFFLAFLRCCQQQQKIPPSKNQWSGPSRQQKRKVKGEEEEEEEKYHEISPRGSSSSLVRPFGRVLWREAACGSAPFLHVCVFFLFNSPSGFLVIGLFLLEAQIQTFRHTRTRAWQPHHTKTVSSRHARVTNSLGGKFFFPFWKN